MIKQIRIQNFKSLADVKVDLAPFTVMIGKNGAGKSSFLQSLEVMTWLLCRASINEAFQANSVTFNELVFAKAATKQIAWTCVVTSGEGDAEGSTSFVYHAAVGKRRYVHVAQEWARLEKDAEVKDWAKIISEGRPALGRIGRTVLVQEKDARIDYTGAAIAHSLLKDVLEQSSLHPAQFAVLKKLATELVGFRHFQI